MAPMLILCVLPAVRTRLVCVRVVEPAYEMTDEEKEMMNVMGFFAFSTTKVRSGLFYLLSLQCFVGRETEHLCVKTAQQFPKVHLSKTWHDLKNQEKLIA